MNAVDVEIDRYLASMRAALADLPDEARDDLLEDLPAHFAEVLEEHGGSLEERLGPPAAYAAELRAAAGLDSGTGPSRGQQNLGIGIATDLAVRWLETADRRLGSAIRHERASDFVRLLRPAWWVARGYFAALLMFELGPLQGLLENPFRWVVVAGLVVLSVRFGPLTPRVPRRSRVVVVVATILIVLFALVRANEMSWNSGGQPVSGTSYDRWNQVTDVYPYDKNGQPLSDVTLYDQNGNPLQLGDYSRCLQDQSQGSTAVPHYPLCKGSQAASIAPSLAPSGNGTPVPSATPSGPVPSVSTSR
jgi:hypothetical protein